MKDLSGKVAVVTGAGSGIGRALAVSFSREGMGVAVADLESDAGQQVTDEITEAGGRAIFIQTDVTRVEDVEALAERTFAEFGAVHVVCNNAGVISFCPLADSTSETWQWVLSVNLGGVVNSVRAFVPRLRQQGGEAHIVNTGSMSGIIPMPAGAGVYVASKYAVTGLSEMLRAELAEEGIGVSLLCPGGVRTRIMEAERNRPENLGPALPGLTLPDEALAAMMDPMDVAARVLAAIRANEFYVFSHPELLDSVDAHYDRLVKNARLAAGI